MAVKNADVQLSLMSNLQAALSLGSSLGRFTIESSQIESSAGGIYSDNGDAKYYRNVAIIVGVVIPIGLSHFLYNFSHHFHCSDYSYEEGSHWRWRS